MKTTMNVLFVIFFSMVTLMASLLMPPPALALRSAVDLPTHPMAAMAGNVGAATKMPRDDLQTALGSVKDDSGQKVKGDGAELQADGRKVDAIVMDEVANDARRVDEATR